MDLDLFLGMLDLPDIAGIQPVVFDLYLCAIQDVLPEQTVLLEIKTAGAMPLWLADALDSEAILPGSFSKYGAAYTRGLEEKKHPIPMIKGEARNVVNL